MAELVTGHAGKAHATAEQAAGLNAGILGLDDYVLNVHDKLKITVVSANKVTIGTGELVMQGRHVSQGTPEDLIVTNGSQGQKRNDLIVCRYTKGSQSVESAELVVVRGTPTTGTPTDPAVNTTSPLDGGTTYDMPLYRIPLDGITIGTPVALFNVLKPMSDVWDSLTPLPTSIQSGVFIGGSNENGICVISYQSPNGKAPDVIVATPGPWPSDDMRGLAITIWENGVDSAQMRLMNTRTGEFGARWPARFSWVAIWN